MAPLPESLAIKIENNAIVTVIIVVVTMTTVKVAFKQKELDYGTSINFLKQYSLIFLIILPK